MDTEDESMATAPREERPSKTNPHLKESKPPGFGKFKGSSSRGRGRGGRSRRTQPYSRPSTSSQSAKPPERPIGSDKKAPILQGRSAPSGTPRKSYFKLYCSNAGSRRLVRHVWSATTMRDPKLNNVVTEQQLLYVTNLAFIARLVRISVAHGVGGFYIPQAEALRQASTALFLPGVLCDYVESLGSIVTGNGVPIIPWVDTPNHLYGAPGFIGLPELMAEGHRPLPPPDDQWGIDWTWIAQWNETATRASSKTLSLRKVNYDTEVGGLTQLVTLSPDGDNLVDMVPSAPMNLLISEFNLGACYYLRDFADQRDWPGDTVEYVTDTFLAPAVRFESVWPPLVVASFRDPTA